MTPTELEPTLISDRYLLSAPLGKGGMSIVFRAWDTRLEVWRAIKVLAPKMLEDEELVRRFEAEARTMASLNHPNIVRVLDVGHDPRVPFIVMELVKGGNIARWVRRNGPMPHRPAVELMIEVCTGLEHAHEHGVIHRDVKPRNILLSLESKPKIIDFGIARVEQAITRTVAGMVLGTPGYMAPEQRTHRSVDPRSDQYGVGATLYALLVGAHPQDLFALDKDPTPVDGLPGPLREIVMRSTRYLPTDRYDDIVVLRQALVDSLAELPETPTHPALVQPLAPAPDIHQVHDSVSRARSSSSLQQPSALSDVSDEGAHTHTGSTRVVLAVGSFATGVAMLVGLGAVIGAALLWFAIQNGHLGSIASWMGEGTTGLEPEPSGLEVPPAVAASSGGAIAPPTAGAAGLGDPEPDGAGELADDADGAGDAEDAEDGEATTASTSGAEPTAQVRPAPSPRRPAPAPTRAVAPTSRPAPAPTSTDDAVADVADVADPEGTADPEVGVADPPPVVVAPPPAPVEPEPPPAPVIEELPPGVFANSGGTFALDRTRMKRLFTGRQFTWADATPVVVVLPVGDAELMAWLEARTGMGARTMRRMLEEASFQGNIGGYVEVDSAADAAAVVARTLGAVSVIPGHLAGSAVAVPHP